MKNLEYNTNEEKMSEIPGLQPINLQTQYKDLFLLDKQIADESDGLLLPMNSAEELRKFLAEDHNSTNIVLNDEAGKHTGYFSYYDIDPEISELLNIGVLKEFRSKGYAQKMMENYFELNKDKNKFILVTRPDNAQAIRFYEKLGYSIKALLKDFYGEGEDRVRLELEKKD